MQIECLLSWGRPPLPIAYDELTSRRSEYINKPMGKSSVQLNYGNKHDRRSGIAMRYPDTLSESPVDIQAT